MSGLVEIQKWLHVWSEEERARRLGVKKPCATALETHGNPENRGEKDGETGITQLPRKRPGAARGE